MMIRWKKIYETNISEIDILNKELVSIINEFYKSVLIDNISDQAEDLIIKMIQISQKLFSEEKRLFEIYAYPEEERSSHLEEHNFLMEVLIKAKKNVKEGDIIICYKLADILRNWLVNHLLITDREFAEYVKKGIKISG